MTRNLTTVGGDFTFEVGTVSTLNMTYYAVQMPHQCDEWEITGREDKQQAIEEMEAFIADAQPALVQLKSTP